MVTARVVVAVTPALACAVLAGSALMLAPAAVIAADLFALTSSAFTAGGGIPRQYTCAGADVPPPLAWQGAPVAARSLALVVDDRDAPDPAAPTMTWVHWVLYNLAPAAGALDGASLPPAAQAGTSDFKRTRYGGPCPPVGRHRYFFKLYALDRELGDLGAPTKAALEAAMHGHIVGQAILIGTYQKGD